MSTQAVGWAINLRDEVSSPTHKCVLILIANYADEDGYCWPSQKTIAAEARCSERTVRSVLADLEAVGLISRKRRKRADGSFTSDGIALQMTTTNSVQRQILPSAKSVKTPAANPAVGKARRRQNPAQPAANPAGLTTFEPSTMVEGSLRSPSTRTTSLVGATAPPASLEADLFGHEPAKPATKSRAAYSPEFEAFWRGWPKSRRELSDKRTAFRRWTDARRRWDTLTLMGAAKRYLSRPDVTKEDHRYCVLAEVFLNGKLDAAVEAFLGEVSENAGATISESQKLDYLRVTGKWRRTWGDPPKGSEGAELT